jgi:hypothetical protein
VEGQGGECVGYHDVLIPGGLVDGLVGAAANRRHHKDKVSEIDIDIRTVLLQRRWWWCLRQRALTRRDWEHAGSSSSSSSSSLLRWQCVILAIEVANLG